MALSFTPRSVPIASVSKKNTDVAVISRGMAVKLDTAVDDGVKKCAATTDPAIGVADKDIAVGEWGNVVTLGAPMVCLAGGAVTRGDKVSPDANSKVATTTTNKDRVIGIANRSAALDELFEVLSIPGAYLSA